MAATGFTPIQLYRTSTASAVPSAGNLADGELAINLTDERLYFKNAAGVVKLLASNAASTGTVSSVAVSGGTTGLTTSGGPITTSGTITLAGTLATTNGGTGLTSFTANGVVYASSSSALTTGSALVFDSFNRLGVGVTPINVGANGEQLQIGNAASTVGAGLTIGSTATADIQFSDATSGTGQYAGLLRYSHSNDSMQFWTASSEQMRLTSTGLGIGTSTPGFAIDIAKSTAVIRIQSTTGTNAAYMLTTNSGGDFYMGRENSTGTTFGSGTGYTSVLWSAGAYPMAFFTNGIERARITSTGAWSFGSSGTATGTAGQVLTSQGAGAAPVWAAPAGGSSYTVRSSNYTAVAGDNILANTSGGSFTITLPASPATGAVINIEDSAQTFSTNPLQIARNGNTIMGLAEDMWSSINGAFFTLIYNGSTWRIA